jgi:hypothetical protein
LRMFQRITHSPQPGPLLYASMDVCPSVSGFRH